jgi:hypothetical protein
MMGMVAVAIQNKAGCAKSLLHTESIPEINLRRIHRWIRLHKIFIFKRRGLH